MTETIRPAQTNNPPRNEEATLAGIRCRFHATNPCSPQSIRRNADVRDSTSRRVALGGYLLTNPAAQRESTTLAYRINWFKMTGMRDAYQDKSERVWRFNQRRRQSRIDYEAIQTSASVSAGGCHILLSGNNRRLIRRIGVFGFDGNSSLTFCSCRSSFT